MTIIEYHRKQNAGRFTIHTIEMGNKWLESVR